MRQAVNYSTNGSDGMTTKDKYNISGNRSHWKNPANSSSKAYRGVDSACDCLGHVGQYLCMRCPFPDGCLHDQEEPYKDEPSPVVKEKKSVYDDASIAEDYQFNNSGR